jgi:hypothetical protein
MRTLAILLAVCTGLLILAPMANADGGSGGETINVTIPPTGSVSCTENGTKLAADPTLTPGDALVCAVTGLGPNEQVDVTVDPDGDDLGTVSTDANGALTFHFTVPDGLAAGTHQLTFTGQTSTATAVFPFESEAASSNPGGGTGAGSGGGSGGGVPGRLPFTGAYVLGPLAGAVVLLAAGAVLTTANRRRRRHG